MGRANAGPMRSAAVDDLPPDDEHKEEECKKVLPPYEKTFAHNTEYFSTFSPDIIEEALIEYLEKNEIDSVVNDQKYKVKFTIKSFEEDVDDTGICIRILEVDAQKVCVEFTMTKGSTLKFYEHYKSIVNGCLQFSNDATYIDPQAEEASKEMHGGIIGSSLTKYTEEDSKLNGILESSQAENL